MTTSSSEPRCHTCLIDLQPCYGRPTLWVPESECGYIIDEKCFVYVGVHQGEIEESLLICVEDVSTGERFDADWTNFWLLAKRGKIQFATEMETLARAADRE